LARCVVIIAGLISTAAPIPEFGGNTISPNSTEHSMQSTLLPGRPGIAALRQFAVIGLICLAAAACGTQNSGSGAGSPGTQASGSGQPTGGPAAADDACTAAQLDVTLDLRSAGVAAGTSLIPLDFTNVSVHNCRLAGYAFVSFAASRSGHQVGAASTADRAMSARTLLLKAGKTAHLWLKVVQATDLPAAQCKPESVAGIRLRLPGQTTAIFIEHRFRTCARRVHGTDLLTVEPFQSGRAHSGTAQ
jgi:hypothetical protein